MGSLKLKGSIEEFVRDLRTFFRDNSEFNKLLHSQSNVEMTDEGIELALRLALSDFNATPPVSSDNIRNVPYAIMMFGGALMLCYVYGLGHTRNEFNYNAGGVSVRVFDKTPYYINWLMAIERRYEKMKYDFKISRNINATLGHSVPSEYAQISAIRR